MLTNLKEAFGPALELSKSLRPRVFTSTTTHTDQETRAAGSEEAAVRTKNKEVVEGEAKEARSITSGDG